MRRLISRIVCALCNHPRARVSADVADGKLPAWRVQQIERIQQIERMRKRKEIEDQVRIAEYAKLVRLMRYNPRTRCHEIDEQALELEHPEFAKFLRKR